MTRQTLAKIEPKSKLVPANPALRQDNKPPGNRDAKDRGQQAVTRVINEFQLDTVEIDTAPEPLAARATIFVLAAMLVSAILWASFAQLDRIVSARGVILSTAPNVVIQPMESAMIRTVEVKVGDRVKADQVLATLDPTFATSDVDQLRTQISSLNAAIARLDAERNGQEFIPDPNGNPEYNSLQLSIWKERRAQYQAKMHEFQERQARSSSAITSSEKERDYLSQRLLILREVEGMRKELEEAKTGSRLNSLIARDSRIEIERNLSRVASTIEQGTHELASIAAEMGVFRRQWDGSVVQDLVTQRNERDRLHEQLIKAERRKDLVQLSSPTDAVVLEIAERSPGSIIRGGDVLFRLVPTDAPLEIEAYIEGSEVGYVAIGDAVQVKIDAFPFQNHGLVEGKLKVISSDAFTDKRGIPEAPAGAYYKARIELTHASLRNVPDDFRLMPGLPLTAEIKVGHRSIMSYLLRPILRGVNESMREP